MRTHNPKYARSEYHTQLANMSFDKIFDLTAGVYFHFYNIWPPRETYHPPRDTVRGYITPNTVYHRLQHNI